MKLDSLIAHNDSVSEVVGAFCGTPIYALAVSSMDMATERETRNAVLASKEFGESPNVAEVLPGEEICADGIIRRTTTAEAVGDDYYKQEKAEENTQKISIAEAQVHSEAGALVTWRPNRVVNKLNEYALLHEEVFA